MQLKKLGLYSLSLFYLHAYASNTGNLNVNFINLSNDQGVVRVALFNSATSYENSDDQGNGALMRAAPQINNHAANVQFKNIPYGTYAIKAYHDENLTETLPRNFFGKPQADYGFSNNPNTFGTPAFSEAAFNINTNNTTLTIDMSH